MRLGRSSGRQTTGMEIAPQTLLAQTLRLAFRLAIVWAGGFLFAVIARAALPDESGIPFFGKQTTQVVPYSRIGFWTCLLAALTVSAMVVVRTMLVDLGFRQPR
jgi:hypothetical protein